VLPHHDVGDLPAGGLREQPYGRLEPGTHAVLAHHPGGERVVGGHRRLAGQLCVVTDQPPRPAQVEPHPVRELARRLAREGEAEHLVGAHVAVRDQPHHPQRHQLCLARPRARNNQQRVVRRRTDHPQLLRAELVREAESVLDLLRRVPRSRHRKTHEGTCLPLPEIGHDVRTAQ
jgi:hypothetical protein